MSLREVVGLAVPVVGVVDILHTSPADHSQALVAVEAGSRLEYTHSMEEHMSFA